MPYPPASAGPAFISCDRPCNVTGRIPTSYAPISSIPDTLCIPAENFLCVSQILRVESVTRLSNAGSTSYSVRKGESLAVSFQARPDVVVTGGSQNLEFMNDPVSAPVICFHVYLSAWQKATQLLGRMSQSEQLPCLEAFHHGWTTRPPTDGKLHCCVG